MVLFAGCGALLLSLPSCSRKAPRVSIEAEEGAGKKAARAKGEGEEKEGAAAPFRLPNDDGGKLLGKVLPPRQQPGPLNNPGRERNRSTKAPHFEPTEVALPRSEGMVPRLREPRRERKLQPHLLTEEELGGPFDAPAVPQRPSFTPGERTRIELESSAVPPPLPIMGRPVPDRASLDDPTTDVSTEAALAAPLPRRTAPAPYQRLGVPDPYENRRPLLVPVPAERELPVTGAPETPKS
jgi:hypothetical protein